uniref:Uncharacterized protein n=1 Tax=Candidatus Methanogaster sp. ANME-2c ERB4 TaxID=2759911 RepID=A0A7G9YPI2_9EURY|nr:hypothetical protein GKKIKBAN_00030 [Methanosarcinales archaeon ANME-2c ERB4]
MFSILLHPTKNHKITNSVEKNGYPQLIQDCNASTIKEILERVLHSITGKFDSAKILAFWL